MRFVVFIGVLLLIAGCTKEVDLVQPSYEPKIVVDGYIETGKAANVFLTMSSPYLTYYDSASIRNTFLNHAKITISTSDGEEEVLTLYRENRFFPPFVYKSVALRGRVGVEYFLEVEVRGQILRSVTTIPAAPVVLNAFFEQVSDTTANLEMEIEPRQDEDTYLFTRVKSRLAGESFHPSYNPVDVVKSSDLSPWRSQIMRSSEFGLYYLNAEEYFYNDYDRYVYDLRDTVDVIAGAVDSVSYRVLSSLFRDRINQENPFSFNGNRIETNIEGGIGRWTGIGISGVIYVSSEN
jgi:hypothetical protein